MITADYLKNFEETIAEKFKGGEVYGPVHLSSGNERQLIEIFKDVKRNDWVFGTYRAHLHALLHGVPRDLLMGEIIAGRSMNLKFPEYRFFTSAIVGGCLPIAAGVSAKLKHEKSKDHVWCFVGDMCASTGTFRDAVQYATGWDLPITFVIEDNGLSVNTPTSYPWNYYIEPWCSPKVKRYTYNNGYYHWGVAPGRSF